MFNAYNLSKYKSSLFSAILCNAFLGYFRMRELVHNTVHDTGRVIQIGHVTYLGHKRFSAHFPSTLKNRSGSKRFNYVSNFDTTAHTCMSCMHSSFICTDKTHQPGAFFATFLVEQSLGTCTKSHQFLTLIGVRHSIIRTSFIQHWGSIRCLGLWYQRPGYRQQREMEVRLHEQVHKKLGLM